MMKFNFIIETPYNDFICRNRYFIFNFKKKGIMTKFLAVINDLL